MKNIRDINKSLGINLPNDTIIYELNFENRSIYINEIEKSPILFVRGKTYLFTTKNVEAISMSGIVFSESFDNIGRQEYTDGFTMYNGEYMSFVPSDSTIDRIFYSHSGVINGGSFANVISTTQPPVVATTIPPLVFFPIDNKVDPRSITCDTQGACVKPIGKGRRSDIRFNPPDYDFLNYTSSSTTTAAPSITTSTTTVTPDDSDLPYEVISYPPTNSSQESRIDQKTYFNPNDFIFNAVGSETATYGNYKTFKFLSDAEFEVIYYGNEDSPYIDFEYFMIGGGGGGGQPGYGGGGGAGAIASGVTRLLPGKYLVTIGQGGLPNENGTNSIFNFISAAGGGAGGSFLNVSQPSEGSTGGAGGNSLGSPPKPLLTSSNIFANAGGSSLGSEHTGAGGGGGASLSGSSSSSDPEERFIGANGGDGISTSIFDNTPTVYGGGGGGGGEELYVGNGGAGGGGSYSFPDGADGLGAGGVGAHTSENSFNAGRGSSGSLILRYNTLAKQFFDENFTDALEITDFKIRGKRVTVFFNPGSEENLPDKYYIDYKKTSDSNFSSIIFAVQENNKNYIMFDLPDYGHYNLRVSVRQNQQTFSGSPIRVTASPYSEKPFIILNKINDEFLSISLKNTSDVVRYKVRTSIDNVSWSDINLGENNSTSILLPKNYSGETKLYIQAGFDTGNGNIVWFENSTIYDNLPSFDSGQFIDPPSSSSIIVEPVSGGVSVSFNPNESADSTIFKIRNTDTNYSEYVTTDKGSPASFLYSDTYSESSTYEISYASINDGGYSGFTELPDTYTASVSEINAPHLLSHEVINKNTLRFNFRGVEGSPVLNYSIVSFPLSGGRKIERGYHPLSNPDDYSILIQLEDSDTVKTIYFSYEFEDSFSNYTTFVFDPSDYRDNTQPPNNFAVINQEESHYEFDISWEENTENSSYEDVYYKILISNNQEISVKNIIVDSPSNFYKYINTTELPRNTTVEFTFTIQAFSKYGESEIVTVNKTVETEKDPNRINNLIYNKVNQIHTFSFSPPIYLGSYDEIDSFKVLIKKFPNNSIYDTLTIPKNVFNFQYVFEDSGFYEFSIAVLVVKSSTGEKGQSRYVSRLVEAPVEAKTPTIHELGFSDLDTFEIVANHATYTEAPELAPDISGYFVSFEADGIVSSFEIEQSDVFTDVEGKDIVKIPFSAIPSKEYNILVSSSTDNGQGLSFTKTITSPPGPRYPDPPTLSDYITVYNGIYVLISPPEYTGWTGKYFSPERRTTIKNYILEAYSDSHTSNELYFSYREGYYFIPDLLPSETYKLKVRCANQSSYYSNYHEPEFNIGSPVGGILFSDNSPFSQNGSVFITGKDHSGNIYEYSEYPELFFLYGQKIVLSCNTESKIFIDRLANLPYSEQIDAIKNDYLQKINPNLLRYSNNLLGSQSVVFSSPSAGIFFYGFDGNNKVELEYANRTFSIPDNPGRLHIVPLDLHTSLSEDNKTLYISFTQFPTSYGLPLIERVEVTISSASRSAEKFTLDTNSDNLAIPVTSERDDNSSITITGKCFDSSGNFLANSEIYSITPYGEYGVIDNFFVEGAGCDLLSLNFNLDIPFEYDTSNRNIVKSIDNSYYTLGYHNIDKHPYVKNITISNNNNITETNPLVIDSEYNFSTRTYGKLNNYDTWFPFLSVVRERSASDNFGTFTASLENSVGEISSTEYAYSIDSKSISLVCVGEEGFCIDSCEVTEDQEVLGKFVAKLDEHNSPEEAVDAATSECQEYPGTIFDPRLGRNLSPSEAVSQLCGRDLGLLIPTLTIESFETSSPTEFQVRIVISSPLEFSFDSSQLIATNATINNVNVGESVVLLTVQSNEGFSGGILFTARAGTVTINSSGAQNSAVSVTINVSPTTTTFAPTTTIPPMVPSSLNRSNVGNRITNPNFCSLGPSTQFVSFIEPLGSFAIPAPGSKSECPPYLVLYLLRETTPVESFPANMGYTILREIEIPSCITDEDGFQQTFGFNYNNTYYSFKIRAFSGPSTYTIEQFSGSRILSLGDEDEADNQPPVSYRYFGLRTAANAISVDETGFLPTFVTNNYSTYYLDGRWKHLFYNEPNSPDNNRSAISKFDVNTADDSYGYYTVLIISKRLITDIILFCESDDSPESFLSDTAYSNYEFIQIDDPEAGQHIFPWLELYVHPDGPANNLHLFRTISMAGDGYYLIGQKGTYTSASNLFFSISSGPIGETLELKNQDFISLGSSELNGQSKIYNTDPRMSFILTSSDFSEVLIRQKHEVKIDIPPSVQYNYTPRQTQVSLGNIKSLSSSSMLPIIDIKTFVNKTARTLSVNITAIPRGIDETLLRAGLISVRTDLDKIMLEFISVINNMTQRIWIKNKISSTLNPLKYTYNATYSINYTSDGDSILLEEAKKQYLTYASAGLIFSYGFVKDIKLCTSLPLEYPPNAWCGGVPSIPSDEDRIFNNSPQFFEEAEYL